MTSPRMSALVFTDGLGRSLLELFERLRCVDSPMEIVLLESRDSDRLSARIVGHLCEFPEVVRVTSAADSRAQQRNEGVKACSTELVCFVDMGWTPAEKFASGMVEALDSDPEAAFVTSRFERLHAAGNWKRVAPAGIDLESLLGRTSKLHPCTVFRKELWRDLGGFDETLSMFELHDFFIRALHAGFHGQINEKCLVRHDPFVSLGYRGHLRRIHYLPAVRALYAKHHSLFEENLATALVAREKQLYELADEYRPLVSRRREVVGEHEHLKAQIEEAKAFLVEQGEPVVDWGDLRRTLPISPEWGMDRGKPVDRYYIESFLADHAEDIQGAVLEVQEDDYTRLFGGDRVAVSDVVDMNPSNAGATVIADLRRATGIASDTYDCFVISQTLHVIDDMESVLEQCYRILKPGGVLLATFPCLSRVCLEYGEHGDFWRMTEAGALELVSGVFPIDGVSTRAFGNVLVATAFLYGLAAEELKKEEFEAYDPYHPVLIGVRAVKPGGRKAERVMRAPSLVSAESSEHSGSILAYHRVADCEMDPHDICLPERDFRAQMQYLADECRPLALEDLVARAEAGDLPPGAVAVTFDDGYLDALETAAPILSDLGIPATFFVTTEGLDRPLAYWWDLLDRFLASPSRLPDELHLRWQGQDRTWLTESPENLATTFHDLYHEILLHSPPAQRDDVLRQLARWSGSELGPVGQARPMKGEELRRLVEIEGMSIGAHGIHHLALSKQCFLTQQKEIFESRIRLEELLDREINSFAYPYGDFDDVGVELVRAADFRFAVTAEDERIGKQRVDRFRLPRRVPPCAGRDRFSAWFRSSGREA